MTHSVGEVARMLDVPASTLRYYESEGLLPALSRSAGGRRQFSDADVEACRVIGCLKESGLSIKRIKGFMNMVIEGDRTLEGRLELFRDRRDALREEIKQLQDTLAILEFKCWYYETAVEAGTEDAVRGMRVDQIPPAHRKAKAALGGR